MTSCSDKSLESVREMISNSDNFLIYKYDSLSNDFMLFNIPSLDTITYLKEIVIFDGKFKKAKAISPNYRFDLISETTLSGEVLIEQSATPYLTVKSCGLEASRQLDYRLGMYLGEIEQNVISKKNDSILYFKSKGGLNDISCGFTKQSDSTILLSITIWRNHQIENQKQDLAKTIEQLETYWSVANRDNKIKLSEVKVHIGYPLKHEDVLKRHLKGFKESKKWLDFVSKNGMKPNYKLTAEIMLETDVYKPLNDFLKAKRFEMVDISLEKIGLVQPEMLEEYGLDSEMIIPMPHMVWIGIGETAVTRGHKTSREKCYI